jgi:hypothetical protein
MAKRTSKKTAKKTHMKSYASFDLWGEKSDEKQEVCIREIGCPKSL